MIDFEKLRAPFPPDRISWRVGSTNRDKTKGMALAYIDARDVMERLDAVCGPENWECHYPHAGQKTVCEIRIRVQRGNDDWEWISKCDGAGDTDFEADKGALSDAFKRSAVRFGIGRYLYDLSAPWVEIEPMGKSFKIKDDQLPKLMRLLMVGKSPQAVPDVTDAKPKKDPLQPWKGPLTKTALMKKLRELTADLALCEDIDSLESCLSGYQAIIEQVRIDVPEWYDGEAHDGFTPLRQRIDDRRAILTQDPSRYLKAG